MDFLGLIKLKKNYNGSQIKQKKIHDVLLMKQIFKHYMLLKGSIMKIKKLTILEKKE